MNIKNLKEGMIIKNYKELCRLLNEGVKTGNAKKAQLKEMDRYFKYTKEGNKFIVQTIYKEPLNKIDNRQLGNNSIYSEDIQELILFTLAQHKDDEVCWSCSKFLKELAMVNNNYSICRKNIPQFSKIIDMEESYIYDFYNTAHKNLRIKLETALNCLMRYKKLLIWKPIMMVYKEIINIELNEFGTPKIKNGEVSYIKNKTFEKATKQEEKLIISTERNVMIDMGFTDLRDVFINGKYDLFIKKVYKELKENGNIYFYYYAYEITYNYDDIKKDIIGYLGKLFTEKQLNDNLIKSFNKSAENRHKNSIKKIKEGNKKIKQQDYLKASLNYVKNNKILIENLINKNAKVIKLKKNIN